MNNEPDEVLLGDVEVVCTACGLGKFDPGGTRGEAVRAFEADHATHATVEVVPESIFRSDYLKRGFTDVDRAHLEPIVTSFAPAPAAAAVTQAPFGKPAATAEAAAAARRSARALMSGRTVRAPISDVREIDQLDPVGHVMEAEGSSVTVRIGPAIVMRPSWDQTFLDMAFILARRGTCSRRQVGVIIVSGTRIVSDGYNGAPAGLRHCDHTDGRDLVDGHCVVAEHAERNALLYAGRDARGGTLYVTCTPCLACTRMAVTVGISRIVYADEYRPDRLVDELCAAAGIALERLTGSVA